MFTHENHFKFGWGEGLYNFDDKKGNYWVDIGRAKYIPTSFKDECIRAAKLIYQNAKKPLMVFYSGGIDSEVIVRSFLDAKIPFEVAIVKINYGEHKNINSHDNVYAFEFSKKNNLKINEIDFDLKNYMSTSWENDAKEYKTPVFGVLIHAKMNSLFPKHHCVFGGGDIKLKRHRYSGRPNLEGMFIEEKEVSISAMENSYFTGNETSPRFYMYTPELMLAWLLDEDVKHFVKYEKAFVSSFAQITYLAIKAFVFYKHWPDMTPRPKYTGFEKIGTIPETYKFWKEKIDLDEEVLKIKEKIKIYNTDPGIIIDYEQLISKLSPI